MDLALASILVSVTMSLITGLTGWLLKSSFDRITALEKTAGEISAAHSKESAAIHERIAAIREQLPSHYVRRDDFKDLGDNIFEALRRIETKLDGKADKS